MGPEYVNIWQVGIESTVSINRITRVPRANEEKSLDVTDETPMANSETQPNEPREKKEYAVERIVNHKKTKKKYATEYCGMATKSLRRHTSQRHIFRRTLSTITGKVKQRERTIGNRQGVKIGGQKKMVNS